jgi:putative FmdB family regulatory protein
MTVPTYDYRCVNCNMVFEVFHSINSTTPQLCPICNQEATKLLSSAAIVYKGSGFYTTDYCFSKTDFKDSSKEKKQKPEKK